MRSLLRTAALMGFTYLMNNKQARQKVMGVVQSFIGKGKQQSTTTNHPM
jgi:hypothetical protein